MALKAYYQDKYLEAGCDEAGRGCLAGPVVAAAVILPKKFSHPELDDSKKLTHKKREELKGVVMKEALAWKIACVDNHEIDAINILNASFLAMHKAIDDLPIQPELLLIDGNRFNSHNTIAHQCIIKGDSKYFSIAAASILAKTFRDDLMRNQSLIYPGYGWETNAGYPTIEHRKAIKELGVTPLHRMSFRLLPEQLELFDSVV